MRLSCNKKGFGISLAFHFLGFWHFLIKTFAAAKVFIFYFWLVDHPAGHPVRFTSEMISHPSPSLVFAPLLSPAHCPLAALSRSDRPLLASEAFRAPPTPFLRVPSDSSSLLLHLHHTPYKRKTCIMCSQDICSHAIMAHTIRDAVN